MASAKLAVIGGALLFSTGGVAIKLSTLTGWQISCLRSLIAAAALAVLLPRLRTGWTWRSVLVAVPYATTFTLYTLANKLTTAANAIFLQDTAPLYILLLGPVVLKERIRSADIGFIIALVLGLGMIFEATAAPSVTATDPALGKVLAACSGVSWALTILGLRWLAVRSATRNEHPMNAIVLGCLAAGGAGAINALPIGHVGIENWVIVIYLGLFQIALAYILVTWGIRQIPALEASLLLLVEPVFTPVWAWLFLRELPAPLAVVGGTVVILATIAYAMREQPVSAGQN